MDMSREKVRELSNFIEIKVSDSSHTSSGVEHCIFRVHEQLRKVNEEAYEPVIVAIGPFHRGKANVQEMEKHKLLYLKQFLEQQGETNVDRYVMALCALEERARKFYAKTISLATDEFVEMMLLDGCFIVELFRRYAMSNLRDDPVLQSIQSQLHVMRDLLLLENQLPFFILVKLCNMIKVPSLLPDLIPMALYFLTPIMNQNLQPEDGIPVDNIKHLLGLVHDTWCFSFARNVNDKAESWKLMNAATELEEAGVQIKKAERSYLFDINFTNGVLEIPPLVVSEYYESPFGNLIAYEQYLPRDQPKYVCDYIAFLDALINSPEDVQLLRHHEIIESQIGDDAMVYTMINKMNQFIVWSTHQEFSYSNIFNSVNEHCGRRRNIWMATLRRKYFNSPWAFVSFLAAVVLLLLTVIQTIFSGLSLNPK